jgi:4-hydroxybenzoate polyprenyltransferase
MTDEERLTQLVRRALPPVAAHHPSRDLWPSVAERMDRRAAWSMFDIGLAAAVAIALVMFPQALWFIAYHL